MLMRACDVRLPARLTRAELDVIADALAPRLWDVSTTRPGLDPGRVAPRAAHHNSSKLPRRNG
jgi:hypothetical protein